MQSTPNNHVVNYYTILGLPPPRGVDLDVISKNELKAAYHRSLLLYHPDKISKYGPHSSSLQTFSSEKQVANARYSIDQIVQAYQTLSEPQLKTAYDTHLLSGQTRLGLFREDSPYKGTHLGVETYDLDDLKYQEKDARWVRACRCGNEDGYMVTEADLERESKDGEIYVPCRGCSLFIKVLFGFLEDEDDVEQA